VHVGGCAALCFAAASSAAAATGDPPRSLGLSPVAASIYEARFALCSLQSLTQLASREGENIDELSSRRAAAILAAKAERGHGRAATEGCTAGLIYRETTDQAFSNPRRDFRVPKDADKYVAPAYLVVVLAFFFFWVLIHATRVARLERMVRDLRGHLANRTSDTKQP
jgi:hypothetical protein